jgi:recombination protein RecT
MSDLTRAAQQAVERRTTQPTIADWITANRGAIETQLAGTMQSEAFVATVLNEIRKSPKLQLATPSSVLGAVVLAAQLRLQIGSGLGQFYLTPRKEKQPDGSRIQVCVPIIGYRGYTALAYRSGMVASISTDLVREGDVFRRGNDSERGRWFVHEPVDDDDEEERPWTRVIAVARLNSGGTVWEALTRKAVLKRRPSGWESGPWRSNPEPMARKTGVRALAPMLPMSVDFAQALSMDEQRVEKLDGVQELVVHRDRREADEQPMALEEGEPAADEEWEARERAEADAYLAAQQDGGDA